MTGSETHAWCGDVAYDTVDCKASQILRGSPGRQLQTIASASTVSHVRLDQLVASPRCEVKHCGKRRMLTRPAAQADVMISAKGAISIIGGLTQMVCQEDRPTYHEHIKPGIVAHGMNTHKARVSKTGPHGCGISVGGRHGMTIGSKE